MKRKQLNYKAAVAASAIGAIFALKGCKSPEKKSDPRPMPTTPLISKPAKDDGSCEVEKGEADPRSPTFDPKSCGYCGDGVVDYRETVDNCPIEFHCGNGICEDGVSFATWVEKGGNYSLQVVVVSEPSECMSDCESGPVRQCPAFLSGGRSISPIIGRVMAQVRSSAGSLMDALGAGQSRVNVTVQVLFNTDGTVTAAGAGARCDAQSCPNKINIIQLANINLVGLRGPNVPVPCYYYVPVSIPERY